MTNTSYTSSSNVNPPVRHKKSKFSFSVGFTAIMALTFGVLSPSSAMAVGTPEVAPTESNSSFGATVDVQLPVEPAPTEAPVEVTDQFIVEFDDAAKGKSAERKKAYGKAAKELGVSVKEVKQVSSTGSIVVKVDEDLAPAEANKFEGVLEADPSIEYVEKDIIMNIAATPNDTHFANQWDLYEAKAGINVTNVWDKNIGKGQVVAVIDSGIVSHSDLNANVLPGYDMMSSASNARDGNGRDSNPKDEGDYRVSGDCNSTAATNSSWHGTHVAGTIAAVANNAKGVAGVAPGAKIVPIRALGSCGGYMSDIADSITWASGGYVAGVPTNANKADVINLSLGGSGSCSLSMQRAIDGAVSKGAVVVTAAGNNNVDASHMTPANCNNVITVAATDRNGARASYSNYGSTVDIAAPGGGTGGGIYSTLNSGTRTASGESYASYQGTSMATPHVAGVLALMRSANPDLTPSQATSQLLGNTRALPGTCSGGCGVGLLDASKAVKFPYVAPTPTEETPAPAPAPEPIPVPVSNPTVKTAGDVLAIDRYGVLWNYQNPVGKRVKIGSGWQVMKDIHVTDWNQDGIQDILAQYKDGRLYIYKGKAAGGFSRYHIGNGWQNYEVTVAKFKTSDKYPSIIARQESSGGLYNYPNPSGHSLSSRTQIGSGWHIFNNLNAIDFDKDGHLDILARDKYGKIKLYRTNGAGKWYSETRRQIGSGWQYFTSMTTMNNYKGTANTGIVAKTTDGKLWYYETGRNTWKPRVLIGGAGWQTYKVANN